MGFVGASWTAPSEAVEDPLHEPRERKGCSRTHLPCYAVLSSDGFYVNFLFVGRKPELLCVGMTLGSLAWGHRGALHVPTIQCRLPISAAEHRPYFGLTFKNFPFSSFLMCCGIKVSVGVDGPLGALLYRSGCLEGGHRLLDPGSWSAAGRLFLKLDKDLLFFLYIKCCQCVT